MTDLYTVVCMQMNRVGIDNRKEIRKANLDRCLEIFGYAALRLSFREYAPLKLVVLPEVFMQGWNDNPAPYSNIFTKVAKDMAIRIPGEETDLLAEQAKKYKTYIAGSAHEVIPEISTEFAFNSAFIIDPKGEVDLQASQVLSLPALQRARRRQPARCLGQVHRSDGRQVRAQEGRYPELHVSGDRDRHRQTGLPDLQRGVLSGTCPGPGSAGLRGDDTFQRHG